MKLTLYLTAAIGVYLSCALAIAKPEQVPEGALEKIHQALAEQTYVKPKKDRQLLVFAKTLGYRHKSIPTGKLLLEELGEKTGAFKATISDDLTNFEPSKIDKFDGILFLSSSGDVFEEAANEDVLKTSLMKFIKSGKGFIGIHAATTVYYDWPEYGDMIGAYFENHPWTSKHRVHVDITPKKEKHPLAAMFQGRALELKEEIYQFRSTPYDPAKLDIFLQLNPGKSDPVKVKINDDKVIAVSWAKYHGKGRVFYTSLGHNDEIYWNPQIIAHYLAGIQWALGDLEAKITQ